VRVGFSASSISQSIAVEQSLVRLLTQRRVGLLCGVAGQTMRAIMSNAANFCHLVLEMAQKKLRFQKNFFTL